MIYTIMKKHYLTDHARLRLSERSVMTEAEFLELANACSVLVYRSDALAQYEIVWSRKDQNGYVLVVQPITGIITTIKRVLSKSGRPCLVHDSRKAPDVGHEDEAGVSRITSAMLEQAVMASGADLSEAQTVLDVLKANEEKILKPYLWHYRWVLRFLCNKPGGGVTTKTKTLGRSAEPAEAPPAKVIEDAIRITKESSGWDGCLSLVGRDDMAVVNEWELRE